MPYKESGVYVVSSNRHAWLAKDNMQATVVKTLKYSSTGYQLGITSVPQ